MTRIDARLRAAVDASLSWYDALCGVRCGIEDGTWVAYDPPPPLHSVAKIVEPGTGAGRALAALESHGEGGVADSFGEPDLRAEGLDLLFDARWIHLDAPEPPSVRPSSRSVVDTPDGLAAWTARPGTAAALLPGLLHRSSFRVLARTADGTPNAGAVTHLGSGVVLVSNVWSAPDVELDWSELIAAVVALHPGRALVGWECGPALTQALDAGFVDIGPQRVWLRAAR